MGQHFMTSVDIYQGVVPVQATVSTADQAVADRASDVGALTSDGMPCSNAVSPAKGVHSWPHTPQPQGAESLTQASTRIPAEQAAQPIGSAAQQQQPARLHDLDPAAGAGQLSSPCAAMERSADLACLPHVAPGPPSLQSWGNNANDQCSLASKSLSLDMFFTAGAASPRKSGAHAADVPGRAVRAEREQGVSPQQAGENATMIDEEAVSSARGARVDSSPALHHCDNAPAFWEGRRRSSSSSGHVHGSSAALSALAQAYSRAGQGSPVAAQEAQAEQVAASEHSPQEISELLRLMAMKIDSQTNLQDMVPPPCPALQATTGACSSPSDLDMDSSRRTTGVMSQNAPQKGPVSEHWGATRHPGLSNPFAAACEQTELEAETQVELRHTPSTRAGLGSAAPPAQDCDAGKSVAALSTFCEAGSYVAPASQCSPFQSAQTVSQGRSNAHSSPDSWNGNTALSATARCAFPYAPGHKSACHYREQRCWGGLDMQLQVTPSWDQPQQIPLQIFCKSIAP